MDSSLPVLVTRLPDRSALARLLRAALRYEIAPVPLSEAPRSGPHTLDLRVPGLPPVLLVAELAGAPHAGHFPLRLRPVHPSQVSELYALIESDSSGPHTIGFEDASPVAKPQVAVGAPQRGPSPVDPRVTARVEWSRAPEPPVHDLRRTVPSAMWNALHSPPAVPPAAPVTSPLPASFPDDPRRTARSAGWTAAALATTQAAVPEPQDDGSAADDRSLSVSVIFEPDMIPEAVVAAAAELSAPSTEPKPPIGNEGVEVAVELAESSPTEAPPDASTSGSSDFFFDEDFANMPMEVPAFADDGTQSLSEAPPTTIGSAPVFTPRTAAAAAAEAASSDAAPAFGVSHPSDDDDATLIRLPGGSSANLRAAPIPAAGMPASDDARTIGETSVPARLRSSDELTPTETSVAPRKKKSTHGSKSGTGSSARKKKSTRPTASTEPPRSSQRPPRPGSGDVDPWLGRKIADGKYAIESAIGSGAAGAVYKATHRELRRTVAIKVLHPHYQQDPVFMKSFRGEALAASQLDHPNVMRVLDFGQEPDGLVYIVMEHLSGRTLQSLLDEERRLQADRAVEIMIQVCAALSVAHDNGIIHRDIKPDNIMLVPSRNDEGGTFDLVKVCDFGIAALQNPTREEAELGLADDVIAGTPEYMSPEQARGSEIDARSDVYACGICLYELMTGRPPFLGETAAEILIKQLEETPRPPSQLLKGLDPIVEEIILRAIQKEPLKRQQSARELRVELKEIIDPADAGGHDDDDERSIVENVPVLDDPASGFPGFFIAFSSAILRLGRFERGHPEAAAAMKELIKAARVVLRGRSEVTFARRDSAKAVGFSVVTGHGEIVDLRRLLGSQLYGSFGYPFIERCVKKGIGALTLREGLPDTELKYIVETLLGELANEPLRKELLSKPLRHVTALFVAFDVVGRDRKLSWKVGLLAARLARDLRALSNVRGISLKKMREIREDLVTAVAHMLTKGDEVRQFLFNSDLVDEAVDNLRGFSGFQVAPLVFERILHEPCVEAVSLLLEDFDAGELDAAVVKSYLRAFATRLLGERSPKSDAAVAELYRRGIVTDGDVPRDLQETIRATSLAEALIREPTQILHALDLIQDPDDYARELATLEAAMAVLARRAEAGALLAAIGMLARHAKGAGKPGSRDNHALRTMKSMIDKQRLLPIANAAIVGSPQQREAGRQLLVLAGSAGAQALYIAREGLSDMSARPQWVKTFRETGPAGWGLLSAVLPRMEAHNDTDVAFVEDLLLSMPERPDAALGEAVAKFLVHPRLRPTALAAIAPLWGERARKPLLDALEFADEPSRIVAVTELRRIRAIDEQAVVIVERFLTVKGTASEELRAACAAALTDVPQSMRARAIALLMKGVEGKRGLVAMLRGDVGTEESLVVTEAMARALITLDRSEGLRALKARLAKSDALARARLAALLTQI